MRDVIIAAAIAIKDYFRTSGVSSGKLFVRASLAIKPWQSVYHSEAYKM